MAKKNVSPRGIKTAMPAGIAPMLCTLTKSVVTSPGYLYEVKWDGYRIISYVRKGSVRMDSRSALDYTNKYPLVADALKALGHDVVVDGEVVVFNETGMPDFDALQLYNGKKMPITYCVFDILWLDGYNLMQLPLVERKDILKGLLGKNDVLRYSESYPDGQTLYDDMLRNNLEGIVAKKMNSPYVQGERANNWLKTPTRKRQEFVIGGWAESANGRAFKSLLFGAYDNKNLIWIGRSGGGYKEKEMPAILKKLKTIETDASPFTNRVLDTKGAVTHWVRPELVANFEFAAWTKSGRIRKPATFLGFREDKNARQVVREVPSAVLAGKAVQIAVPSVGNHDTRVNTKKAKSLSGAKRATDAGGNWQAVERQNREDQIEFPLDDCSIELYNVDREIWSGLTKGMLIQYYHRMSDIILPYISDRPQSLHVRLHGAHAPGLYIKDMEGRQPDCATVFSDNRRHEKAGKRNTIDYLVCNNEATLLWMINLGCIDVNPWSSRTINVLQPDYLIVDLDPSEEERTVASLKRLRNTAMAAKQFCLDHRLQFFAKTSGKTGLHFLVPCSGIDFPAARAITENICSGIQQMVPGDATVSVSRERREGKVFVDFSQNDYGDTIAAPYCVRPFELPLVSAPLDHREINSKLDPQSFTMDTIDKRLQKKGDLFEHLFDKKIIDANNKSLKKM